MTIPCIQDGKGSANAFGTALSWLPPPSRFPSRPSGLQSTFAGDDLVALIDHRMKLVDGIERALNERRASRPRGQQIYRDRANRQHAERMAAATAFKGERA